MPFYEEESLHSLYNQDVAWFFQYREVAQSVVPIFVCPSNSGPNPFTDRLLNSVLLLAARGTHYTIDQELGVTTYAFCKGITDSWCHGDNFGPPGPPFTDRGPSQILKVELDRGMFDLNWAVPIRRITDGTANTIAMGEGAGGPHWPIARFHGTRSAGKGDPKAADRWEPYGSPMGQLRTAQMAWIIAEPTFDPLFSIGQLVGATVTACTLEPMNKNPVTGAWAHVATLASCNKSLPSRLRPTNKIPPCQRVGDHTCGHHVANNFRSDHPGGCNFLFADGSVHFIDESIDMATYQILSTVMGSESVDFPLD